MVLGVASPACASPGKDKKLGKNGEVPIQWNLPKPKVEAHPDVAPSTAGGNGDGSNTLPFTNFDNGDMVVVQGTATGHAGCWADARYTSVYSYCVWSANLTSGVTGRVLLEQPIKYRQYDYAYGIWVPTKDSFGASVVTFCAAQNGEPYNISSSKTDYTKWYCSKLPWAGWKSKAAVDLDGDGGYWVWPIDLVNDSQTSVFASAS